MHRIDACVLRVDQKCGLGSYAGFETRHHEVHRRPHHGRSASRGFNPDAQHATARNLGLSVRARAGASAKNAEPMIVACLRNRSSAYNGALTCTPSRRSLTSRARGRWGRSEAAIIKLHLPTDG